VTSRALGLVLLVGAALRFATLDAQSLWYDEAVTGHLLTLSLPDLWRAIPDSESTPPLYYVLAWLWTHVFGVGEVGLRSLSALLGTATIGVVWALGRRLGGERAGLLAAALVAFNPMLVWFSQEARGYALLVALGALSALLWLRALDDGFVLRSSNDPAPTAGHPPHSPTSGRRYTRLLAWGVVAALALATHYYALFLIAPQAAWLVLRTPGWRNRATALAVPVLAAVALAPLALGQRANDSANFIADSPLLTRLAQVPKQFLVGYDAPLEALLVAVSALAFVAGFAGLAALLTGRQDGDESLARARTEGALIAGLTAAALALPVLAALAGEDHLITRNVLAALPLVCALGGAGLAALGRIAARPAALAAVAACAAGAVAVVGVARDPQLQRDDWREAVAALGPITAPRLIVATPGSALVPLRYYLPRLRRARPPQLRTAEIDYIALPERRPGTRPKPPRPAAPVAPGPGYALAGRTDGATFTVLRWRAPAPRAEPIGPRPGLDGTSGALLRIGP
jgi:mannosyltransferase